MVKRSYGDINSGPVVGEKERVAQQVEGGRVQRKREE